MRPGRDPRLLALVIAAAEALEAPPDHKLFDFRSYPIYGTLAYRGAYYDATTENDHATEHVFKAGIKVLFGAATLQQNDRYGATLDLPMLPVRANSLTENLD